MYTRVKTHTLFGAFCKRAAFFLICLYYLEIVLRLSTSDSFFTWGLLKILFISVPAAMLFACVITTLPKKAGRITGIVIMALLFLLHSSQIVYHTVFGVYYSLFSVQNGMGQITQFWQVILQTIWNRAVAILFCAPPIYAFIVFERHMALRKLKGEGVRAAAITTVSAQLLLFFTILPALINGGSGIARFYGQSDLESSFSEAGMLSSTSIQMLKKIIPEQSNSALEAFTLPPPANTFLVTDGEDNSGGATDLPVETTEPPSWLGKNNELDIDFAALAEAEGNEALKQLHAYFAAQPVSAQNEYTGMFEGYNLIYITAEAFSPYAVSEELTPTLYKMATEGFHFTNFYNPVWGVSTSDGEYVACTGLYPKSGVWSFKRSGANWMPFCMGNQFRALGADTKAYHNHTYNYYGRDVSHPNMGYDYKGLGSGLDVKATWPESDLEMMEKTVDDYIGKQPFHAYYMTVSGHMAYNFTGNMMSYINREAVAGLPYSDGCRAYVACQLELEKAMTYLLERLEAAGVAEKTLIVISADHYPYGLTDEEISEFLGHPVEKEFEKYRSTLIMYVKGMEPVVIDRPVASVDIMPTVSNLLGLPYDSRLLMGTDIFGGQPPLVVFQTRSFITDMGSYNIKTSTFTPNEGVEVPEGYRKAVSKIIDGKLAASAKILDLDYYRKLEPLITGNER